MRITVLHKISFLNFRTARVWGLFIFTVWFLACHQSIIPNLPIDPIQEDPPAQEIVPDSTSNPTVMREQKIEWLKANASPFRTVDPADEDFSDLDYLKNAIGDARIVMLGEQTTWDGTTIALKARLVKFLHQEMGFDILAIESGMFDIDQAWQDIRTGDNPVDVLRNALPIAWGYSQQFQPVIDFLGGHAVSGDLELIGLDCQFTGLYTIELLTPMLSTYVSSVGINVTQVAGWSNFICQLEKIVAGSRAIPDYERQNAFFETIELLINLLREQTNQTDMEARFWLRMLDNIDTQAKRTWWDWKLGWRRPPPDWWNAKSEMMGRNLIFYANEKYPDKKIIVWSTSRHVCKDVSDQAITVSSTMVTQGMRTMADVISEILGAQLYTLNFTAYQGTIIPYFGNPYYNVPPLDIGPIWKGDFEDLAHAAGLEYAIIDFKNLVDFRNMDSKDIPASHGAWLREELVISPIQHARMKARDWTQITDCIIFTRDMFPSIRSSYQVVNSLSGLPE